MCAYISCGLRQTLWDSLPSVPISPNGLRQGSPRIHLPFFIVFPRLSRSVWHTYIHTHTEKHTNAVHMCASYMVAVVAFPYQRLSPIKGAVMGGKLSIIICCGLILAPGCVVEWHLRHRQEEEAWREVGELEGSRGWKVEGSWRWGEREWDEGKGQWKEKKQSTKASGGRGKRQAVWSNFTRLVAPRRQHTPLHSKISHTCTHTHILHLCPPPPLAGGVGVGGRHSGPLFDI